MIWNEGSGSWWKFQSASLPESITCNVIGVILQFLTIIIGLGHVQAVYAIASIKAMGTALVRELLIELKIGINLEEWVVGLTYVVDQIR